MSRRRTYLYLFCIPWIGAAAQASVLNMDLNFSAQNQNMWGPGAASVLDVSVPLASGHWNLSAHVGHVNKVWPVGRYGAELSAGTSGHAKLSFETHLTSGDVDVSYPITAQLALPEVGAYRSGQAFEISSSFATLAGGELATHSPQGRVGIDLNLAANAYVDARVCVSGCAHGHATLFNGSLSKELLSIASTDDASFDVHGPLSDKLGIGGYARMPEIDTAGSWEGNELARRWRRSFPGGEC